MTFKSLLIATLAALAGAAGPGAALAASSEQPQGAPAPAAAPVHVPVDALLPPLPLPDKAQYALQVGLFGTSQAAGAMVARLKQAKLPVQEVIAAVDQGGAAWYVVAVGAYANIEQARAAARKLGLSLNTPVQRVIVLPAKPAPTT